MQTPNNLLILAKMKKCRKNMTKLQEKIDLLTSIIDQQSIHVSKDFQCNLPPSEQKPEIIISDEASVEIVLTSNEPEPAATPQDLKSTAKKLVSRFYYHISEKMKEGSLNQLQALKQMCNKQYKDNPYKQLFQGFQKLYVNSELKCKQCNKSFSNVIQSTTHVLQDHLNDLSVFICIQCKLTFQNKEKLDDHILQQHNPTFNNQVPEKQFQKQPTLQLNKVIQNVDMYSLPPTLPQPIKQKILFQSQINQQHNHVPYQDDSRIQEELSENKNSQEQFSMISECMKQEQQQTYTNDMESHNNQKKASSIKIKFITKKNQSLNY
ncbi:unnamed protein product (macronuclear) [Paramecium tetraurelia]|uniref:C2H2-type domain-containing protein n=1 Tax=Paramecium tetraurelia TaxID=5888 RepID=A0CTM9_PARTE|nr:uncharacterized protein GSPATT00010380001 [Paramecium tetraurelia]CAK74146.1 unnamed protein product [Paramecium tetraurelia]|eukprot:XP_001441543.1 hypothetical protein (macronuclear) [Paramecium tetraurelia strain d4-2]